MVMMMIGKIQASSSVRLLKEESGEKRICRRFWLQAGGRRIKEYRGFRRLEAYGEGTLATDG